MLISKQHKHTRIRTFSFNMQTLGYFWLLICAELVFGENNCCDNDKDAITANNGQIYCIKDLSKVNAALFACPNGGMILDSYKVLDDNVVDIFGRVFKTYVRMCYQQSH